MVKKIFPLLLLFLSACAPSQSVDLTPVPPPSPSPVVVLLPTATSTPLPLTPTPTEIPCDPLVADFCVTDGHFLLRRSIFPPDNDSVDRAYPYASTENGNRDPHHGVEFPNPSGTPVHAAGEGVVVFAGPDDAKIYSPWRNYYGNLVVIKHEDDLFTLYAHLSKIEVAAGEAVSVGQKIGEVGQSGVAIGSHLHFEVRQGNAEDYFATVNPELWLAPRLPFGVISLSIKDADGKFVRAQIVLEQYSTAGKILEDYYLETYHPSLALGVENAAMGGLPKGRYRIALSYNGRVYQRWVEVESGKLTEVVIVVK